MARRRERVVRFWSGGRLHDLAPAAAGRHVGRPEGVLHPTPSERRALVVALRGVTVSELAAVLGVAQTTAARTVEHLRLKGLLGPGGRGLDLELTAEGRAAALAAVTGRAER